MCTAVIASIVLFSIHSGAQDKRKLISGPDPVYPEVAKVARVSGVVKVEIVIGPDGNVKETRIIGGHPALVESVKEALQKWKYVPSSGESVVSLQFAFHP